MIDMKERKPEYHPYAKIKGKEPPFDLLFTQDGFKTIDEAKDQIHLWANECDYHLSSAEIKVVYDYDWDNIETIRVF